MILGFKQMSSSIHTEPINSFLQPEKQNVLQKIFFRLYFLYSCLVHSATCKTKGVMCHWLLLTCFPFLQYFLLILLHQTLVFLVCKLNNIDMNLLETMTAQLQIHRKIASSFWIDSVHTTKYNCLPFKLIWSDTTTGTLQYNTWPLSIYTRLRHFIAGAV